MRSLVLGSLCFLCVALVFQASTLHAAEEIKDVEKKKDEKPATPAKDDAPSVDFQSEETFIDVPDALRSRNYVQRAIFSSAVKETSNFSFSRLYLNQLIGYDAIFQPANRGPFAKYASGCLSFAAGYVSEGGHAVELGINLSAVSNIFLGYKYIFRPTGISFWPYAGLGVGTEMSSLNFNDNPPAGVAYYGSNTLIFTNVGVMIPLVDVGLKVEMRFNFYGLDRLVLTTGAGVVFFL